MKLKYVATVMCEHEYPDDGKACTEMAQFTADPEAHTLESFGDAAKAFFQEKGWVCCRPGNAPHNLCPFHAKRRFSRLVGQKPTKRG